MTRKPTRNNSPDWEMLYQRRTVVIMILCGIVAFIALILQLAKVMIRDHDYYLSAAVENQVRTTTVSASRGNIYDTNMKILAGSASVKTVYISPAELLKYDEDKEAITAKLAEILEVDYNSIWEKWSDTESWYKVIKARVELETADRISAYIHGGYLKDPNYRHLNDEVKDRGYLCSVHLLDDSKRYYPYSTLCSQIIGFVGTDSYGLEGLEALYDSTLQGENGRIVRTAAANGTEMMFTGYESTYEATDGSSVVITLDTTVQYYLKKHIEQAIRDNQILNGGIGIVMNVKTGAILGMISVPDYDLNEFGTLNETYQAKLDAEFPRSRKNAEDGDGEEEPEDEEPAFDMDAYNERYIEYLQLQWRNRAIADTYEPGSTFKIITLASALEEGVISTDDHFDCRGSMEVKGRTESLHCWKDAGHGDQTLSQATQNSCNVAFATIGLRLGAKRFYDYIDAFGLFDKTGIDLNGESTSIWWTRSVFEDPSNHSQLASASFGQTFNVTPIQMITAVSAAVNGGYLMKPYVVKQVLDGDGTVIQNVTPTVVRQVISEDTSRTVCEILERVVGSPTGTGKNASVAGYSVGGKTGTSEKVGQASAEYMVSFIGIAPMEDPEIAVLVILDSPSRYSGIYISGGGMAAPCVGNILSDILPYLGVEQKGSGTSANVTVPNVRSATVEDATAQLEALGFQVAVDGVGETVTDQAPVGNQKVTSGSKIILYAGTEKPSALVTVPNMIGKSYRAAIQYFEAFGLCVKTAGVLPSDSNTIVVQRQSIDAGEQVPYGTVIEIGLIDNDTSIMETIA